MRKGYRRITVRVPAKQFAELQKWTGYGPTRLVREALQAVLDDAERRTHRGALKSLTEEGQTPEIS